ncbi:MAG: hypothetical protein MJ162_08985 [Treponema sp.]|nr:hypothetical protein [Treponema sp.]
MSETIEKQLNELEETAITGDSILNFGCEYPAQFSTHIFYIGENNEKDILEELQDRMNVYMESEVFTSDDVALQLDVDDFYFELLDSNMDFKSSMVNIHPNSEMREKLVDKYVSLMTKQFGQPRAIHKIDGHFDDYVLRIFFLRNIYNILFVEFDSYMMMILYGTSK